MKRKYFKKSFISLLIMLSVLFGTLTLWGYFSINSNTRHSEQLDFIKQFEKNQKDIENSINISISLGQLLTNSEAARLYANENSQYKDNNFYTILSIQRMLSSNQTFFSNLYLNLAMFVESGDIVITGSNTTDKKDFVAETNISLDYIFESFEQNSSPGYYYKLLSNGTAVYMVCQRIHENLSKVYLCTTLMQADLSYVSNLINNKSLLILNHYFDEDLDIIRKNPPSGNLSITYKQEHAGKKAAIIYCSLKNMPEIILMTRFEHSPHNYFITTSFVLLFVVAMMLAVVLSYTLSKILYKPVQHIINLLGAEENSKKKLDEWDFISNSTSMIIKTNQILKTELKKKQDLSKSKFLFDLLNGFVWGEALNQNIEMYNLEFLKEGCIVVLFAKEHPYGRRNNYIAYNTQNSEYSEIFNIIRKHLLNSTSGIGISLENNESLFILSAYRDNTHNILAAINDVRNETDIHIRAVVSNEINNIENYKYIYSTLTNILEKRYMRGDLDILTMDDSDHGRTHNYCSFEDEQRLTEFLLSNESEKALLFMNQLLHRVYNSNLSDADFSNFRVSLIDFIQRLFYTIEKTSQDLFDGEDVFQVLKDCSKEDFRSTIVRVLKTIASSIHSDILSRHNELTDHILEFINENLDRDLSMDDVCNRFGMSQSTIARRLKDRNLLFKTYVNEQRIIKSKQLMKENPQLMVKDIANMVGFNNVGSFNRLFKKSEFVSPKQYIDNMRHQSTLNA